MGRKRVCISCLRRVRVSRRQVVTHHAVSRGTMADRRRTTLIIFELTRETDRTHRLTGREERRKQKQKRKKYLHFSSLSVTRVVLKLNREVDPVDLAVRRSIFFFDCDRACCLRKATIRSRENRNEKKFVHVEAKSSRKTIAGLANRRGRNHALFEGLRTRFDEG